MFRRAVKVVKSESFQKRCRFLRLFNNFMGEKRNYFLMEKGSLTDYEIKF